MTWGVQQYMGLGVGDQRLSTYKPMTFRHIWPGHILLRHSVPAPTSAVQTPTTVLDPGTYRWESDDATGVTARVELGGVTL